MTAAGRQAGQFAGSIAIKTIVRAAPTRPPTPHRAATMPTPEQLIQLARTGANNGDDLGAQSVELVCNALIDSLVRAEAAENRARKAEQSLALERVSTSLLERALLAERARTRLLERQLKERIDGFALVILCRAPDGFEEPTVRRESPALRHEQVTKVIDVPCVEVDRG